MTNILLCIILIVSIAALAICLVLLVRPRGTSEDIGSVVREELREGREEARSTGRELRSELADNLKAGTDTLFKSMELSGKSQQASLDSMAKQLKDLTHSNQDMLNRIRDTFESRLKELQEGNEKKLGEMRKEATEGLKATSDSISKVLETTRSEQKEKLEEMTKQLKELGESNGKSLDQVRMTLETQIKEMREGNEKHLGEMRVGAAEGIKSTNEMLAASLEGISKAQQLQVEGMTKQLKELQDGNEKKLEEMRKTVDEKLQDTLEKRLGESFKLVSDRLEHVHKGLGEMQALATGVGDLKRVLTNVKTRGTWAEVQLGALLEQILSANQYEKNICVKRDSNERVEFAIRLPGSRNDPQSQVWLPIDSKFPKEDYERLQDAAEKADAEAVQVALDALTRTVRSAAREISSKYVSPPETTDFAIMFLATEGLYAEILRQPSIVEEIQRTHRIVIAGPTTLVAILTSLQMGFKTLAIEKRASEVWQVLAAVKSEFGKFGDVLAKVKKQLATAANTIEQTDVRTRVIVRKLQSVEELPAIAASEILALPIEETVGGILDIDLEILREEPGPSLT